MILVLVNYNNPSTHTQTQTWRQHHTRYSSRKEL